MKKLVVGITAPGSIILLEGQMKYFTKLGYETYLIAPDDERTRFFCEIEGCQLLPVSIKREISLWSDFCSLWEIIKHYRKVKPDIINVGTPKMGLLGMLAAKYCGIKRRIYTCRGFRYEHEKGFKRWLLKRLEWLTGVCAQVIICISPSVKELGIRDHLFKEKKCLVINKGSSNGIDLNKFNKDRVLKSDKEELSNKLGLDNHFVFGFVGRLIDRKGVKELYDAFCRIYDKDRNSRLLIVGLFDFNQISGKKIIEKMQDHKGIIMPGRTDNVPLYLSLIDVFILPAWWEGFGNVLVQAAAMGIPVIGTFGTGTRDAVSNGFNGVLVDSKNVSQLEKAMEELKNDDDKRTLMGNNGIEWAKNFESKIIWEGMKKLYLSE